MLKVGRYTAALLLVTVGIMLLLDQTTGSDHLALLLDWWPVLLIMLGCEYLIFNFTYPKGDRQLRLDMSGLIISVLISAVVVGTTQSDRFPTEWMENLDFNIETLNLSFSSESGYRFDQELISIPIPAKAQKIIIDNPNGNVELRQGDVEDIQITTTIWVDKVDEEEARQIAKQSVIDYSGESQLKITAKGQEYTGGFPNKRKPRMNLSITVPENQRADYELALVNGKVDVDGLPVLEQLKAHTTNGAISIARVEGTVNAKTTNGAVDVSEIGGSVSLSTTNGAVAAKDIAGKLKVDTTNGAVTVENVEGALEVDTLNGKITVREAQAGIKAEVTNGAISIHTHTVGGSYNLENMTSSIELKIPESADAEIEGSTSYSSISTNLPLTIDGKKISGVLGTGEHYIKIETNNKIHVNRID